MVLQSLILQPSVESSMFVHWKMIFCYFQWIPCSFFVFLFLWGKGNTVNYGSSICSHFSVLENLLTSVSDLSLKQSMSSFPGVQIKTAASSSWQYSSTICDYNKYVCITEKNYNLYPVLSTCFLEGIFFFLVGCYCTLDPGMWKTSESNFKIFSEMLSHILGLHCFSHKLFPYLFLQTDNIFFLWLKI